MILNIILLLFSFNSNETTVATRITSSYLYNMELERKEYKANYDSLIEFTKLKEGFRSNFYMDGKFLAIGYGQRQAFYKYKISEPISKEQAEVILKVSLEDHFKMVKRIYPKVKGNKALALVHISYTVGIGRLQQLYKNNELNTIKLLQIGDKECRLFEINLFYSK